MMFLAIGFSLISCQKETEIDDPTSGNKAIIEETKNRLQHNWNFNATVFNIFLPTSSTDTLAGKLGDYFDFRQDSFCYSYYGNLRDTVAYEVLSANEMIFGGVLVEINELNRVSFVFKRTNRSDSTHDENIIILSK